jgi:hypothetical protein
MRTADKAAAMKSAVEATETAAVESAAKAAATAAMKSATMAAAVTAANFDQSVGDLFRRQRNSARNCRHHKTSLKICARVRAEARVRIRWCRNFSRSFPCRPLQKLMRRT